MALIADALAVILTAVGLGLFFVYLVPWALKKVCRKPATVTLITKDSTPTEVPLTAPTQTEGDIHESRQS